jgi:hypothetical protein
MNQLTAQQIFDKSIQENGVYRTADGIENMLNYRTFCRHDA